MNTDFNAVKANNKFALFRFVPGWGEPGEWLIQLGRHTMITLDDVSGTGNQLEYLQRFVADKYILETAENDWKRVGTKDDAIRLCLEYTGYDETSREKDMGIINSLKRMIVENNDSISNFFDEIPADTVKSFAYLNRLSESYRTEIIRDVLNREDIVIAYDRMAKGEHVGVGWRNETLLHDYPDSREAELVASMLRGDTPRPSQKTE